MEDAPNFIAVEIDVDEIDDDRLAGVAVESGVELQMPGDAERNLQRRIEALKEIAAQRTLQQ